MNKLYIITGPAGVGKSTISKSISERLEKSAWQGDTCGFIFFEVKEISAKYIQHFETSVKTAHAQYIFKKDLNSS